MPVAGCAVQQLLDHDGMALVLLLQVVSWGAAQCSADRVVAALHSLFCAFAEEEQQRRQAGPLAGTAARRGLINPSALRHALSTLPGQQYRVGECQMYGRQAVSGQNDWLCTVNGCAQ